MIFKIFLWYVLILWFGLTGFKLLFNSRLRCDRVLHGAARPRFPAKRRLFLFLWRGKKSARARPAPPKHAPRSDADSAGCVPNSLSFATSHRLPKVTVQWRALSRGRGIRGACVVRASACGGLRWPTRWVEWISRPRLRRFRFPRVYRLRFTLSFALLGKMVKVKYVFVSRGVPESRRRAECPLPPRIELRIERYGERRRERVKPRNFSFTTLLFLLWQVIV